MPTLETVKQTIYTISKIAEVRFLSYMLFRKSADQEAVEANQQFDSSTNARVICWAYV
jgi:hypothetical protein